jgi:hypothetical protein
MQNRTDKASASPIDKERPIDVSQELPAWNPVSLEGPSISSPLRRVLADMPDEYRLEPLGVIEAEMRRVLHTELADTPGSQPPAARGSSAGG